MTKANLFFAYHLFEIFRDSTGVPCDELPTAEHVDKEILCSQDLCNKSWNLKPRSGFATPELASQVVAERLCLSDICQSFALPHLRRLTIIVNEGVFKTIRVLHIQNTWCFAYFTPLMPFENRKKHTVCNYNEKY
ncbi:MAG: hypothetical protein A7316_01500 [Candidatus Altiarchaeales archaeon WOR_SM1_86-2]|nr:MAG: hypothetical protein A7316_01500 [Candidatus Altiarchaeales archaeon WOR_SM1_86-2]